LPIKPEKEPEKGSSTIIANKTRKRSQKRGQVQLLPIKPEKGSGIFSQPETGDGAPAGDEKK